MSDLLHMNGIPTFKSSKGLRYPKYFEYAKQHDDMHWRSSEIVLGQDIQDFAKASQEEKDLITKILRLFTQNEIQVNYGYSKMLNIFKPYEVQAWLFAAGQREFTHVENYSLFTETIGLPDSIYQEFLDIPQMSAKAEYLEKAKIKKYEDYKALGLSNVDLDKVYRKDVARMMAVYAGGTENISLMAQFAMLLKFQFEGKYPGLCTIVEWSIRDETHHGLVNSELFRDFIRENQDIWDDSLKFDIYQAIREIVAYEQALVDYFNPFNSSNADLKRYIEYRADIALNELGMKKNFGTTTNPLPYMDDVVGQIMTDFFAGTVTEYSGNLEGSWGDVSFEHWKVSKEDPDTCRGSEI